MFSSFLVSGMTSAFCHDCTSTYVTGPVTHFVFASQFPGIGQVSVAARCSIAFWAYFRHVQSPRRLTLFLMLLEYLCRAFTILCFRCLSVMASSAAQSIPIWPKIHRQIHDTENLRLYLPNSYRLLRCQPHGFRNFF